MRGVVALLGDRPLLYSHPVYQYFQRAYELNGHALHWEPDADPGSEQWSELDAQLRQHPATLMLWEDQPLPQVEAALAERGIRSVAFRRLGNRPATGDFMSEMRGNMERLRQAASSGG